MSDKFSHKKESIRARAKSIATKQGEQQQINAAIDNFLGQLNQRLTSVEELVAGLCDAVGMDDVQAAVQERRRAAGEARIEAEAKQLEVGVEAGFVTTVETVGEKTFIVGIEHDKDGNLCAYGPQQAHFEKLTPEFQALLTGKKVGDEVKTTQGNTFKLTGAYAVDSEKAKEHFEAEAKKAAEKMEAEKAAAKAEAPAAAEAATPSDQPVS